MTQPLSYQASNSAVYYAPPKRIDIGRTIGGSIVAAFFGIIGAVLYAKILPQFPSAILRGCTVGVAALCTGLMGFGVVRCGRVRITGVAALIGAASGLFVLYVMWLVWVHDLLGKFLNIDYWKLIAHPQTFFDIIRRINSVGTWKYSGTQVDGFPLALLWVGEAGIILTAAVLMPIKGMPEDEPVCLQCKTKCRSIGRLPRFDAAYESNVVGAVQSRNFEAIHGLSAPRHSDAPEITLRLVSCPKCGQTNVLTINHLAWARINNSLKVQTKPLVDGLLITPDEVTRFKAVAQTIAGERAKTV